MEASDVKRLKDLEEENSRLKRTYADLSLDNQILKDLFAKKAGPFHKKKSDRRASRRLRNFCEQGLSLSIFSPFKVLLSYS